MRPRTATDGWSSSSPRDPAEAEGLLDAAAYRAFVEELEA